MIKLGQKFEEWFLTSKIPLEMQLQKHFHGISIEEFFNFSREFVKKRKAVLPL